MKKSFMSWKSFDFGPDEVKPKTKKPSQSLTSHDLKWDQHTTIRENGKNSSQKASFDFFSRLSPKDVSDLAVHPKKLEEVKSWLERTFCNGTNVHTSFLLLSGPTGSGKTASINVLCKNMGISVSEWINPVDQDFELVRGPNQVNKFLEFLTTESNYTSLFEDASLKRIVLVEDFPNIFMKNHEEFHNILEECYYKSKHPIVFICTEVASNKVNMVYNLFPQEILTKYGIAHISFNACAPTLMKTALKRAHDLVQKNKDIFKTPSPKIIDAILSSSTGDIRCAINQYYFASLLGSEEMPTEKIVTSKTGTKRKRTEKSASIKIMAKDETLGLFHALGRILNPKRNENGTLNCDFDSLIRELESQPENTVSFLFTNYIKYFGDLAECQKASELLSFSQTFFTKWTERNDLHVYPLWVSIIGLMSVNNHKVSKWNQIEGPKKINSIRRQKTLSCLDEYYVNVIKNAK